MLVRRQENQAGTLNMQLVVSVTNEWMGSDNPACFKPVPQLEKSNVSTTTKLFYPPLIYELYLSELCCELSQNIRVHHGFYLGRNTKYSLIAQSASASKKLIGLHTMLYFYQFY